MLQDAAICLRASTVFVGHSNRDQRRVAATELQVSAMQVPPDQGNGVNGYVQLARDAEHCSSLGPSVALFRLPLPHVFEFKCACACVSRNVGPT